MHRSTLTLWLALLTLGAMAPPAPATTVATATAPARADVDLDDVPIANALRLLAEIYDVSIATGQLPETHVTVRLRGVGADEAFDSVAAAAGLAIARHGAIVRIAPPETAPAATPETLERARRQQLVDRVLRLGAASGEEVLKAVTPLLEPGLEAATYDGTGHLLTVSALPPTLERIEAVLAELTRPPAQFEIEVRVVEIARTALERMGAQGSFQLDIRGGVLASTFPLDGLDDSHRYLPAPSDLAGLGNLGTGSGSEVGTFRDSGFRFGRIDARGIGLLIQMLEQSGEARVMATPKVTTLDNRLARISMVTTLRIPTFTQNQAFGTTTVSGIETLDVGTTLEVRPRSVEGRQILLTVIPEVSELEPEVQVFTQTGLTQGLPVVTRRRTETEVILESGETLIIGGLVSKRETKTLGKTPGLANIPVLGRLFRLKGRDSASSELLVFVTPRELPPAEERRAKVRVDDAWIATGLAAQVDAARAQIANGTPAERAAAVADLEKIDRDLLEAGVDVSPDVVALGGDREPEVRVAAALFLLHQRPARAVAELTRFDDSRGVALALVAADVAPHLRAALAELLAGAADGAASEPALGWSGTPEEIAISGDPAAAARVRAALELLARRAPDLRHLVGFALATIHTGALRTTVDPALRGAWLESGETELQHLALRLVQLATMVFESRVHGVAVGSEQSLEKAVHEEIRALERLTGAPCPPEQAEATLRQVLGAGDRKGVGDV